VGERNYWGNEWGKTEGATEGVGGSDGEGLACWPPLYRGRLSERQREEPRPLYESCCKRWM